MVGVIVGSKKLGINPDNIATPLAASFGDLITLGLLALIGQGFYYCMGENNVMNKVQKCFQFLLKQSYLSIFFFTLLVCSPLSIHLLPGVCHILVSDAALGYNFFSAP